MQPIAEMISTIAHRAKVDPTILSRCAEACFACAATCQSCADACLGESHVDKLRRCIRLNLDCADQCFATGNMVLRTFEPDPRLLQTALEACALACATCGAECQRHAAMHEHCRVCAESCMACERACRELLRALGGSSQPS